MKVFLYVKLLFVASVNEVIAKWAAFQEEVRLIDQCSEKKKKKEEQQLIVVGNYRVWVFLRQKKSKIKLVQNRILMHSIVF